MSLFSFIDTEKSESFVSVQVWQLFGQVSFNLLELLQLLSISETIVYYTVSVIYMMLFWGCYLQMFYFQQTLPLSMYILIIYFPSSALGYNNIRKQHKLCQTPHPPQELLKYGSTTCTFSNSCFLFWHWSLLNE